MLFIIEQPYASKTTIQTAAIDRLYLKKTYVLYHYELLEKHPEYTSATLYHYYSATNCHAKNATQ